MRGGRRGRGGREVGEGGREGGEGAITERGGAKLCA
jgi:hypothetical protein